MTRHTRLLSLDLSIDLGLKSSGASSLCFYLGKVTPLFNSIGVLEPSGSTIISWKDFCSDWRAASLGPGTKGVNPKSPDVVRSVWQSSVASLCSATTKTWRKSRDYNAILSNFPPPSSCTLTWQDLGLKRLKGFSSCRLRNVIQRHCRTCWEWF